MKKTSLPETMTFQWPGFLLRQHQLEDAGPLFALVDAERPRLRQFLSWMGHTTNVSDTEAYIRRCHENWEASEFSYLIIDQESNRFLGNISVIRISWNDARCEFGYWLTSDAEGRGIISNAVQRLEGLLFGIGFHRIEIHCRGINRRSVAVAIRNGYLCEGILRDAEFDHHQFWDRHIFAKLSSG